jgi:GAF domain-containing protein
MTATDDDAIAELQRANGALRLERDAVRTENTALVDALAQRNLAFEERIEHQAATMNILREMSASPGDAQPVFDLIVRQVRVLLNTPSAGLFEYDGKLVHYRANSGAGNTFGSSEYATYRDGWPKVPDRGSLTCRAILDGTVVHIRDLPAEPGISQATLGLGHMTQVTVPLMRDGRAIGGISTGSMRVDGISDIQIDLLKTFAEQAVIAIGSAETYRELQERTAALGLRNSEFGERIEQQSATIDVLKVMSSTPDDTQPVFDQIARRAQQLCDSLGASLFEYDGQLVHARCLLYDGDPVARAQLATMFPMVPTRTSPPCRAILDKQVVHIRDADLDPELLPFVRKLGAKSIVSLPLLREGRAIGAIALNAKEPGGFSDSQIALLQTFAEQAVIAIGSAETYRALQTRTADLQESLEYQTATSEVLKVISRSTFDLDPVFQTVVTTAARLCRADQATIYRYQDGGYRWAAGHGLPPEYERIEREFRGRPGTGTLVGRVALEGRMVEILDAWTDPFYEIKDDARVGGVRTMLGVPLLRNDLPIGLIALARQRIEAFTEREIALVNTFADQAIIAIENTRLLTEQQEALEQQTATAEVLEVINASPGNLMPVFDTMLEKAMKLCDASFGVLRRYDNGLLFPLASRGVPAAFAEFSANTIAPPTPNASPALSLEAKRPIQRLDIRESGAYKDGDSGARAIADLGGARTVLHVPLVKDDISVGLVTLYRHDVRAFSDREISLLENFAAQAVIAIENARLLHELRTALDTTQATLRELKTAQANLIQAEKMASLGQLTAGIAHEIKNPLNFVNNFAELSVDLLAELKATAAPGFALLTVDQRADIEDVSAMLTGNLQKINEHGKRADGIVRSMLEHSRGASGERRTVEINPLVEEALNLAYHGARAQDQDFNITLERDYGAGIPPIKLNPQDITRVILNLISNGFYAANKRAHGGSTTALAPSLKVATRNANDAVEIRVRDNGTGIPVDIRDKLFQPFFTTKPSGEGTGLGLSITYDIVTKAHGGTISVDSVVDEFTEFVVTLPREIFASAGGQA